MEYVFGVSVCVAFFLMGAWHYRHPTRPWFQGGYWRPGRELSRATAMFWMVLSAYGLVAILCDGIR